MTYTQQGDALFYHTPDGGENNVENGLMEMTQFDSSVYLCLMGGNAEDDATPAGEKFQWSGNEDEQFENQFRSRFQSMINGRPVTSQLIRDLGSAAALDILDGHPGIVTEVLSKVSVDGQRRLTVTSKLTLSSGKIADVITGIPTQ